MVGWNFEFGDALVLEVTPMLGGVFGSVNGIAPGFLLSLGYRQLALSSQGEYLFDAAGRTGDFLYTWSELKLDARRVVPDWAGDPADARLREQPRRPAGLPRRILLERRRARRLRVQPGVDDADGVVAVAGGG